MAAIRSTTQFLYRELYPPLFSFSPKSLKLVPAQPLIGPIEHLVARASVSYSPLRAAASARAESDNKKPSARLAQVHELLSAAKERAKDGANQPIPKITLENVTVSFARSGGPGGQNVNKVNTKVDMRFNVQNAYWLSERVREKILLMEKNRINKDGELVISSTKTRTQKGNIEDALEKLQAIIDAASYVPPPPSEDQVKRIEKLAAIGEKKRLDKKKEHSQKKAMRRSRDSWD